MIRRCRDEDVDTIWEIINTAASAYEGVIPEDRWAEPYMSMAELEHEIEDGVQFWVYEEQGELLGLMGMQRADDVSLVRHAYVRPTRQREGIGGRLLSHLRRKAELPLLVGTWAAASWAIRFYEKNGFRLVSSEEKDKLLNRYWSIPARQVETSVVLADPEWLDRGRRDVGQERSRGVL